jgi:SAM-dependent methyltransferase
VIDTAVRGIAMSWMVGPEVLEMGYGDGLWSGGIIEHYDHSSVVDMAKELLNAAKELHGDSLRVHHSMFETFEPPHRYDTVLASYVLEHVEDPVAVLERIKNWLTDEGRLIVAVPNANSLHRRLAVKMGLQERTTDLGPTDFEGGHRRVYTLSGILQDVARAGFTVPRTRGCFLKPLPQRRLADLPGEVLDGLIAMGNEIPIDWASEVILECRPLSAGHSQR